MSKARADPGVRVRVLARPAEPPSPAGATRSLQEAEIEMEATEAQRIWRPENLELLARSYWRYLRRISLGLIRVRDGAEHRSVVLVAHPLVLLRFRAPRYDVAKDLGQVTWPIERGVLVAGSGRGRGYLRIRVRRIGERDGDQVLRVSTEVANYYPLLGLTGRLSRAGTRLYAGTQLRLHVWITNGFLRSLASLDLPAPGASPRQAGSD